MIFSPVEIRWSERFDFPAQAIIVGKILISIPLISYWLLTQNKSDGMVLLYSLIRPKECCYMGIPALKPKPHPSLFASLDDVKMFVHNYSGLVHFIDVNHVVKFCSPGVREFFGDGAEMLEERQIRHFFIHMRDRFIREKDDVRDLLQHQFDLSEDIAAMGRDILTALPRSLRKLLALDIDAFIAKLPKSVATLWPESLLPSLVSDMSYLIRRRDGYGKVSASGRPIFLDGSYEYLGWLIVSHLTDISKKTYIEARSRGELILPTEQELETIKTRVQMLHKGVLLWFPKKPVSTQLALVPDAESRQASSESPADDDSLTLNELKLQVQAAAHTGDASKLYQVYEKVAELFDEVQKGLRSVFGILNQKVTIRFRTHKPPKYTSKTGEVSEYTQTQARWTEKGKEKSKTIKP